MPLTVAVTGHAPGGMSQATEIESTPPVDPMLDETENILEDYVSVLSANRTLIAK